MSGVRVEVADDTLIVVAAYDESHKANWPGFDGGDLVVMDTSAGGHPTGAYIQAFRDYPEYDSYLFVQDSMKATLPDCVAPFRGLGPVVAWCSFALFFDDETQLRWVKDQYPDAPSPDEGIFGPVFYATREAMVAAEPFFPALPSTKLEAQGTERAWAYAFKQAGVPLNALYEFCIPPMEDGSYQPFTKAFANRQ